MFMLTKQLDDKIDGLIEILSIAPPSHINTTVSDVSNLQNDIYRHRGALVCHLL